MMTAVLAYVNMLERDAKSSCFLVVLSISRK
jgi:hypothetical protein